MALNMYVLPAGYNSFSTSTPHHLVIVLMIALTITASFVTDPIVKTMAT